MCGVLKIKKNKYENEKLKSIRFRVNKVTQ